MVTYGIKAREVITDATVGGSGGSNWKSLPDEENYNRTPKRSLKISPDTQIGLDSKLNRIRLDQTASPTLRGVISQGSPRGRALTLDTPDRISNRLARKLVLGKRRLHSESTNDSSFVKVTPQAIGTKNKKKKGQVSDKGQTRLVDIWKKVHEEAQGNHTGGLVTVKVDAETKDEPKEPDTAGGR